MERIVINLRRPVKRRIQKVMKKTKDLGLRKRCRIVLLYNEGLGCRRISKIVDVAPATAIRVGRRLLERGEAALEDRRREKGIAKVDLDLLQALAELLGRCPQDFGYLRTTWTQELLAKVLAREAGVQVCPRTVGRMLYRLNARWG